MNLEQAEQAEILRQFERGRRLFILTNNEGWADVLDILEAEVVKAEFRLMNLPPGSTDEMLRDLHAHARAARSIFEQFQLRIAQQIENGQQLPVFNQSDFEHTNL